MFYTQNENCINFVTQLESLLKGNKNVLDQIRIVREILLLNINRLAQVELDFDLKDKQMKKIPIYEGEDFNMQFFVWKAGVRSTKHAHFGNWGNILVIKGEITVKEYDLSEIDWDNMTFKILKKNQKTFSAGQIFSLIQNYNALHSMSNLTEQPVVTLHIYQKKQQDYYSVKKGLLIGK